MTPRYPLVLLFCILLFAVTTEMRAQDCPRLISGRVVDESGEGIPGAVVIIVGTYIGTVASESGHFCIRIMRPGDHMLRVEALRYTSREIAASVRTGQDTSYTIVLSESDVWGDTLYWPLYVYPNERVEPETTGAETTLSRESLLRLN